MTEITEMHQEHLELLRERLSSSSAPVTAARIAEAVRAEGLALGSATTAELVRSLRDELVGLGPLQSFADQPGITDVLLDGDGVIWTDGEHGLQNTEVSIDSEERRRALARRLIAASGGRLDEGSPCADGRIGAFRIHAVIPPVALEGTMISVRVAGRSTANLDSLARGWRQARLWKEAVRTIVRDKHNCLISGATGSGKTSLLAAMVAQAAADERIVVVEDSAELMPEHPHVLHLQSRQGNIEGVGGVDMGHLVRQTLRMRPDRLIVGECRGAELRDFLTAMNTGHRGAGGTVHANSPEAVPARLVAMGALAGMSPETVALQAAAALHAVIHVERIHGSRMPTALSLVKQDRGQLQLTSVLELANGVTVRGPGWEEFAS